MSGRPLPALMLARGEKAALRELERGPAGLALRARIILACAAGRTNQDVAAALGTSVQTVGKWRARFLAHRLDGLRDRPRAGAPRSIEDTAIETVIVRALETKPAGATRWSSRLMAKATGMSASSVQRIWHAFGLRPHRTEGFVLSANPLFVESVHDILGLYVSQPDRALVLCVDEQHLSASTGRAQAIPRRRPIDVERVGLASLFVALDKATGRAADIRHRPHRFDRRRRFIDAIDRIAPAELALHVVIYADGNRETPMIRDWRAKRRLDRIHVAPTYAAWIKQIERWFALLAERQLQGGARSGLLELEKAIVSFTGRHRAAPAPFSWTQTPRGTDGRRARPRGPRKPRFLKRTSGSGR
jgi:transposase